VIEVESFEIKDRMLTVCNDRCEKWSDTVANRLNNCIDLVAAEARYHQNAIRIVLILLFSLKEADQSDLDKLDAFNKTCEWLETTDRDLLTLAHLTEKSKCFIGSTTSYSEKWLKSKLMERYGSRLFLLMLMDAEMLFAGIIWHHS
jgi:hypothetical protein